jgi:hypothetical protein
MGPCSRWHSFPIACIFFIILACNFSKATSPITNQLPLDAVVSQTIAALVTRTGVMTQTTQVLGVTMAPTTFLPLDVSTGTPTNTQTLSPQASFTATSTKTSTITTTSTFTATLTKTFTTTPTLTSTSTSTPPHISQTLGRVNVASGGSGSAVATCPAGGIIVGGGFATNTKMVVLKSLKQQNGWLVFATNTSNASQDLNVYGYCLFGVPASTNQVTASTLVPKASTGKIVVNCPAGSIMTGGGFATSHIHQPITNSTPTFDNGWYATAENLTESDFELDVYATCLPGVHAAVNIHSSTYSILAGKVGGGRANCEGARYIGASSGGFHLESDLSIYLSSQLSNTYWESYAMNNGIKSRVISVDAVCLMTMLM